MSDHIEGSKADLEQKKRSTRPAGLPVLDPSVPLPAAADMERCVLSCFMQAPSFTAEAVGGRLKEEHFTVGAHGLLWRVMCERFNGGQPVDPPTLIRALIESKELEQIGGPATLSEIYTAQQNAAQAAYYGGKVHAAYVQRRRVLLGMRFTAAMMDPGAATEGDEIVAELEAELLALSGDKFYSAREQRPSSSVLKNVVQKLIHRYTHRGQILGLQWGFPEVDRRCNGFQEEDFIVVAARPAMGKTAFATSICERVGMDALNSGGENVPVLFFSLEMSDEQIVERRLMGQAHMSLGSARTGMFSHAQGSVLFASCESLEKTRGQTILQRAGQMVETALRNYMAWLDRSPKRMAAVKKRIAQEFGGKDEAFVRHLETEMGELACALAAIDSDVITWKDGYGMTTAAIRAEIRKWIRSIKWQRGTGAPPPMVCIDYLQLVKGVRKTSKDDLRQNMIEVCDTFKGLAKELGIVIMGLAQIKRNDKNPGAEPQLHEMQESGALEQYADYVFTLHRPCYYKPWRVLKQPDRNRWDKLALGRDRAEVNDARGGGDDDDDNGPPISDEEWTQAALAFRASGMTTDDWTGQTYYEADVLLGIKKARHGPTDDVRILFRGPEVRFVPVQEKLFSNNPDEREHGGD